MCKLFARGTMFLVLVVSGAAPAMAQSQYTLSTAPWSATPFTDFKTLEAVDSLGNQTYSATAFPVMVEGVVLNNPADMADSRAGNPNGTVDPAQPPTSIPYNPDPYWQVFVQSVDVNHDGDFGGAAVYAAQNYGNVPPALTFPGGMPTPDPTESYTAEGWYEDVQRLSVGVANNVNSQPAVIGGPIVAGDLVIVEALGGLSFAGKEILNEEHEVSPNTQFQFINLGYVGLPTATPLHLADIWNNTSNAVLFDPTRASGGEHYESTLVQLEDVTLASGQASNWVANGYVTVQDSYGRQFTVELGTNSSFTPANAPTGMFDVTGIFDKESPSSGSDNTTGYQLWVMDPTTVVSVSNSSSYTWQASSGTLNNAANWVEGAPSGTNTDQLTFGNAATASYTATVDGSQGAWTTNNLTFSNVSGVTGTINQVNAGRLVLAGVSPAITQLGAGPVVFSAPVEFSANSSINGSGTGNVTFTGGLTLDSSVTLTQSLPTTVAVDAAPTLGANSSLQINSGTMLFKVNSGTATVGTGVTATVGAAATLQLAGSVPAFSGGNLVNVVNNGSAANGGGLLVTGTNQSVGTITGTATTSSGATTYSGDTVVGDGGAGESLTATQILQNTLTINAGATVTISPSGAGIPASALASATVATASNPFSSIVEMVRSGDPTAIGSSQDINTIDAELAAADPDLNVAALNNVASIFQARYPASDGETVSSGALLGWLTDANRMIVEDSPADEESLANLEGDLLFGSNYAASLNALDSAEFAGSANPVPEPSTVMLAAVGAVGLGLCFRRRGKQAIAAATRFPSDGGYRQSRVGPL